MFVDWCFVQAFGNSPAKQLLCGGFSAYTPTSAQYYKNKGKYHKSDPLPGDQVFFKNSIRICHTGIVNKVTSTTVYTIEGNTSAGSSVIANGGAVCKKSYALSNSAIDGYSRPDWSLVEEVEEKKSGWIAEDGGWRFYLSNTGECVRNKWYEDGDKWYWFDGAGIMVSNVWYEYNGGWYYLGSDGAMVKGLQNAGGKWYYLDADGKMVTEPVTLEPDDNGALQYPGLAE